MAGQVVPFFGKGLCEIVRYIGEKGEGDRSVRFQNVDALHIALAEEGGAGYFVTCDGTIAKKAKRVQNELRVRVCSILEFVGEVAPNAENNQ